MSLRFISAEDDETCEVLLNMDHIVFIEEALDGKTCHVYLDNEARYTIKQSIDVVWELLNNNDLMVG